MTLTLVLTALLGAGACNSPQAAVERVASGSKLPAASSKLADDLVLKIEQITSGPKHHYFGYIGHVGNVPWNKSGRRIVCLRVPFQDRMPGPDDPAEIVLLDVEKEYAETKVDETRGWNPQQGTMLYWNPESQENQFFFNDRDRKTGKVFCVLFDRERGRVKEFRFEDTPIGNSGVAQKGGAFLAINYARLARLRAVTGYRGATDWTEGVAHPEDDGVFRVDVATGKKTLLVSFKTLRDAVEDEIPFVKDVPLFINHTLWNRDGDRIFFFARGNWSGKRKPGTKKINAGFYVGSDGSGLTRMKTHIGGHPEWAEGHVMIGRLKDDQILYDTDKQKVVGKLGTPKIFPKPLSSPTS